VTRSLHEVFCSRLVAGLSAAACLAPAVALAQGVDCAGLRAQVAAIDQASLQTSPFAGAIQQQRADLQRSTSYAHSIGCDRQQFFFFGSPPPPQCGGLNAHIAQTQANLARLVANARASSNSPERQQLLARYNAYCHGMDTASQPQQHGFFESLFGGEHDDNPPSQDSLDQLPPAAEENPTPQGGSEVLCVRHCDGAFFPLNYSTRIGSESLTDFCKASCPNAEVSVYTRVPGEVIETAVGLDGKPYTDLPGALKYQKSLDPTCSCRAPGASWADTLAGAEQILSSGGNADVMVTPEKSDEMARPQPNSKAKATGGAAKPAPGKAAAQSGDDIQATDAAAAAQVPTASSDSSGIATGEVKNGAAYSQGQGQTVEVTGPDGVKRRVRIVAPQL
jgi:hypothetical protein